MNVWKWLGGITILTVIIIIQYYFYSLSSPAVIPSQTCIPSPSPPCVNPSPVVNSPSINPSSPFSHRSNTPRLPLQFSSSFKKALEEHEQRQKDIIAGHADKSKWVISDPQSMGICNRLQSIASGFLLALLTERAFAISWGTGAGGINPKVNNEGSLVVQDINELFKEPFDWSLDHSRGQSTKGFDGNWHSGDLQEFLCEDLNQKYSENVFVVTSWDYYAPFLAHNPVYREKILKWFGALDNVYGPILRYLTKLQPALQTQVDNFVSQKFKTYTVGVHLRMKGNFNYKMEKEHEAAAWQCAGIPFGDTVNPAGSIAFPGFDENGDYITLPKENTTIFLASDDGETTENAKKKYGDRLITQESNSPINRETKDAIVRGVIDLFILSRCDDLVTSFQSSYGRTAAALAGIVPLQITHEAKCMREVSPEACSCGWGDIKKMRCYNPEIHDTPYTVNQVGCSTCDGAARYPPRDYALNKK